MKAKDSLLPILFIVTAIIGLFVLVYSLPSTPQVGTAIGTQNVYASGLSDETKELVEDLRWKHYPSWVMDDIDEWWAQSYPYIKFDDGILYIVDDDVTWFIEMQRKEE